MVVYIATNEKVPSEAKSADADWLIISAQQMQLKMKKKQSRRNADISKSTEAPTFCDEREAFEGETNKVATWNIN